MKTRFDRNDQVDVSGTTPEFVRELAECMSRDTGVPIWKVTHDPDMPLSVTHTCTHLRIDDSKTRAEHIMIAVINDVSTMNTVDRFEAISIVERHRAERQSETPSFNGPKFNEYDQVNVEGMHVSQIESIAERIASDLGYRIWDESLGLEVLGEHHFLRRESIGTDVGVFRSNHNFNTLSEGELSHIVGWSKAQASEEEVDDRPKFNKHDQVNTEGMSEDEVYQIAHRMAEDIGTVVWDDPIALNKTRDTYQFVRKGMPGRDVGVFESHEEFHTVSSDMLDQIMGWDLPTHFSLDYQVNVTGMSEDQIRRIAHRMAIDLDLPVYEDSIGLDVVAKGYHYLQPSAAHEIALFSEKQSSITLTEQELEHIMNHTHSWTHYRVTTANEQFGPEDEVSVRGLSKDEIRQVAERMASDLGTVVWRLPFALTVNRADNTIRPSIHDGEIGVFSKREDENVLTQQRVNEIMGWSKAEATESIHPTVVDAEPRMFTASFSVDTPKKNVRFHHQDQIDVAHLDQDSIRDLAFKMADDLGVEVWDSPIGSEVRTGSQAILGEYRYLRLNNVGRVGVMMYDPDYNTLTEQQVNDITGANMQAKDLGDFEQYQADITGVDQGMINRVANKLSRLTGVAIWSHSIALEETSVCQHLRISRNKEPFPVIAVLPSMLEKETITIEKLEHMIDTYTIKAAPKFKRSHQVDVINLDPHTIRLLAFKMAEDLDLKVWDSDIGLRVLRVQVSPGCAQYRYLGVNPDGEVGVITRESTCTLIATDLALEMAGLAEPKQEGQGTPDENWAELCKAFVTNGMMSSYIQSEQPSLTSYIMDRLTAAKEAEDSVVQHQEPTKIECLIEDVLQVGGELIVGSNDYRIKIKDGQYLVGYTVDEALEFVKNWTRLEQQRIR